MLMATKENKKIVRSLARTDRPSSITREIKGTKQKKEREIERLFNRITRVDKMVFIHLSLVMLILKIMLIIACCTRFSCLFRVESWLVFLLQGHYKFKRNNLFLFLEEKQKHGERERKKTTFRKLVVDGMIQFTRSWFNHAQ